MAITPKVDYEYSEGQVAVEELAKEMKVSRKEMDGGDVQSKTMLMGIVRNVPEDTITVNPLIYFSPHGLICECGDFMLEETPNRTNKTISAFCTNPNCSQHMITKVVKLPFITDYVVKDLSC